MKESCVAQLLHLLPGKGGVLEGALSRTIGHLGDVAGQGGHAHRVSRSGGIPLVDRDDRRLDESFEQVLDVAIELPVLDGHGGLSSKRLNQLHLSGFIREHVLLRGGFVTDNGQYVRFPVDELKYAHDRVPVVLHGNDQHRLGPVSYLLVEPTVERVGLGVGNLVGVVDDERVAVQCREARHAGLVERQREVRGGQIGKGGVLGSQEVKRLLPVLPLFDQVQAAGVAVGQPSGLCEDHAEQRVGIAFAHEGHADLVQLPQVPMDLAQLRVRSPSCQVVRRSPHGRADRAVTRLVTTQVIQSEKEATGRVGGLPRAGAVGQNGHMTRHGPHITRLAEVVGEDQHRRSVARGDLGKAGDPYYLHPLAQSGQCLRRTPGLREDQEFRHRISRSALSKAAPAPSRSPRASRISPFNRNTSALNSSSPMPARVDDAS